MKLDITHNASVDSNFYLTSYFLLGSEFVETNEWRFDLLTADLDHALVVCDLTRVSGSSHRQPMRDQDL